MKRLKFFNFTHLIILLLINQQITAFPAQPVNVTRTTRASGKFLEIKLPVKITTMEDLVNWVRNAMETMASRIDITLAPGSGNESENNQKSVRKMAKIKKEMKVEKAKTQARHTYVELESPWLRGENDIFAPLINAEAFLPLIIGDGNNRFAVEDLQKYTYNSVRPQLPTSTQSSVVKMETRKNENSKMPMADFSRESQDIKMNNDTKLPVPFAIPFEAYITITRDSEQQQQPQQQLVETTPETRYPPDDFPPYFDKKPFNTLENSTITKKQQQLQLPQRGKKKENSRKRQIAVLGDILRMLGLTPKLTNKTMIQEAATTTAAIAKPTKKSRQFVNRPNIEDVPTRPRRNETSQRQEFDEDGDVGGGGGDSGGNRADDDDDDDYEEDEGSLGSIADLVPLAIPILQDLSDPETETDLIELIQAGIPLIAGLSEGDDDGNGGVQEILNMVVPIITKIVTDGEGSDIGALIGPVFGLLAPFIGPIFAPILGPLIRTISNPPTEGSSLPVLINAIVGPLSQPQEPSGMSPLSIVIAGTTAALLRELKPGTTGGSDLGALIGAILTGVISGTSAGLSGGSSADQGGGGGGGGYAPYGAPLNVVNGKIQNFPTPISSATVNAGFPARPSSVMPHNSHQFNKRPSPAANFGNVGPNARPSANYPQQYQNYQKPGPAAPVYIHPAYAYPHGPVPAAATNGNGGSSYLPYGGTTAVPANSVNPIALIGTSVKDILGAGVSVVSSLVNAVFGILGASSEESPKPSYGPPHQSGPYNHASG